MTGIGNQNGAGEDLRPPEGPSREETPPYGEGMRRDPAPGDPKTLPREWDLEECMTATYWG